MVHLDEFLTITTDAEELEDVGAAFELKGGIDGARRLYERAIELAKPPRKGPHFDLGNVYMGLNMPDLAIQQYEIAMRSDSSSLAHVYNYGYVLNIFHDPRAVQYFERAIELFERNRKELNPRSVKPMRFKL